MADTSNDPGDRERMFSKRLWERDGMIEQVSFLSERAAPLMEKKIRDYDLQLRDMIKLQIKQRLDLTEEMKAWSPHDSTLKQELADREESNPQGKFVATRDARSSS